MKKLMILVLALALLAGCHNPQTADPTNASTDPATTVATTEPTQATTEDVEYEGDATSYYMDAVYPQQIDRYYTAISQQWDEVTYLDNEMCPLVARYYNGSPLDNVGFTFMDLDGDGIWELIIGAIANAEINPLIFEIWALKDDQPVMIAQSGNHNRYYLQYAKETNQWSVANEAENGAANHAVYYLQLVNGEFQVVKGVIFDMMANEESPWFATTDLDWDVSNDTPIDEATATQISDEGRSTYAAAEYFPYCLYK